MKASASNFLSVVQGEYMISSDPDVVLSTVLGSCVSVCLYDPRVNLGGMNHFLLPGDRDTSSGNVKYGVNAMELLINGMLTQGALKPDLKAKLFGACTMGLSTRQIGQSNQQFALSFLADEGIEVVSSSLGGTQARRVRFFPTTGQAQQLLVPNQEVNEHVPNLPKSAPPAPEVELF